MLNLRTKDLKDIIKDLLSVDKRQATWDILDMYFKYATSLGDFDVIGELSMKAEHRDLYLKCAEKAYTKARTSEELYAARANLYKAYNRMNYPEKALFYIELQLQQKPNDYDTLMNKAANISLNGDKKTSDELLNQTLDRYPDKRAKDEHMLCSQWLRNGETTKGILGFIGAFKDKSCYLDKQMKLKYWDGDDISGETLVVRNEGGYGDQIINIRFFDNLKAMGIRPILLDEHGEFSKSITGLFRRHGYEVETNPNFLHAGWYWTPMMALPGYLGLSEDELWDKPYLNPLRETNIKSDKFKIGIKCSGNPFFLQDEYRKIPIEKILEYLPENADIYYIDTEKVDHPRVTNTSDLINSWEDTLDIIDEMDMIVSSCTSVIHAAGAMGKRTVVMVPIAEYYIWTTSKCDETSPWYGDNFTVLRQQTPRKWDEPLSRMNEIVLDEMK